MFDDVRPHSQGRTFISPVGSCGGKSPIPAFPKGKEASVSPIPAFPKGKELYPNALARIGLVNYPFCESVKYQLRVTPTANRNSYRVAMIGLVDTQGSVLRPQPWAEESQLLQSCQGQAPSQPSPRGRSSIPMH